MINNIDYIKLSLELHLFFARIMKEHSLFLEAGFTGKDDEYKKVAADFQNKFADILNRVVNIANNNISNDVLTSEEIVTPNTLLSENKTSYLLGKNIDTSITEKEMNLRSGIASDNPQLILMVDEINKQALPLISNLIDFKNDVLNKVLTCQMYTTNYPLLISHIMNEAIVYYNLLNKLINRQTLTEREIYEQEIFWNNIMKEHAQFIRGLLDPSEKNLIATADTYIYKYNQILDFYKTSNYDLTLVSLEEATSIKNFKAAGEKGILACEIRSIILPLLADHVLREANHFIRILKGYSKQ